VLSYLVGGFGLYVAVRGNVTGGIYLIFVAFILSQGARSAEVQTAVVSRIEHLRVSDVMDAEPVALPADTKLDRALDDYFLRYRWDWFPVVDVGGRFLGLATRENLEKVPEALRPGSHVSEVLSTDHREGVPDRRGRAARGAARVGGAGAARAIMAVDGEGVLRGVVTIEQVSRALQPATTLA